MTKTKISATVVADSKNQFGDRITTMLVTFPRIILAEFNTHRMFSRNTASSRAIPFEKMLKSIKEDPFIPIAWQKDHKGMQGTEYFDDLETFGSKDGESKKDHIKRNWLFMKDLAVQQAKELSSVGLTKQLCNRLLEPFMWTTVIVTATEWENFFALRCPRYVTLDNTEYRSWKDLIDDKKSKEAPEDWIESAKNYNILDRLKCNKGQAEIHMMALAEAMWDARNESIPEELDPGYLHIPYGKEIEKMIESGNNNLLYPSDEDAHEIYNSDSIVSKLAIKISTIMCARTSYTVVGTEMSEWSLQKYVDKYEELKNASPIHASPFEHCAEAMGEDNRWYYTSQQGEGIKDLEANLGWSGNFKGFIQHRKTIPNENIRK